MQRHIQARLQGKADYRPNQHDLAGEQCTGFGDKAQHGEAGQHAEPGGEQSRQADEVAVLLVIHPQQGIHRHGQQQGEYRKDPVVGGNFTGFQPGEQAQANGQHADGGSPLPPKSQATVFMQAGVALAQQVDGALRMTARRVAPAHANWRRKG